MQPEYSGLDRSAILSEYSALDRQVHAKLTRLHKISQLIRLNVQKNA